MKIDFSGTSDLRSIDYDNEGIAIFEMAPRVGCYHENDFLRTFRKEEELGHIRANTWIVLDMTKIEFFLSLPLYECCLNIAMFRKKNNREFRIIFVVGDNDEV